MLGVVSISFSLVLRHYHASHSTCLWIIILNIDPEYIALLLIENIIDRPIIWYSNGRGIFVTSRTVLTSLLDHRSSWCRVLDIHYFGILWYTIFLNTLNDYATTVPSTWGQPVVGQGLFVHSHIRISFHVCNALALSKQYAMIINSHMGQNISFKESLFWDICFYKNVVCLDIKWLALRTIRNIWNRKWYDKTVIIYIQIKPRVRNYMHGLSWQVKGIHRVDQSQTLPYQLNKISPSSMSLYAT